MAGIFLLMIALLTFVPCQGLLAQASAKSAAANASAVAMPKKKTDSDTLALALAVVETHKPRDVDTSMLVGGLQCDADGNFYLRNDRTFGSPIQKFNLKGEKVADFLASSSNDLPNLPPQLAHSGEFTVAENEDLYLEIMASMTEHDLLVFGKDGTYKSKVVIDIGAVWHVKKLAVFASGDFLIAGEKWQKAEQNYAPFTAIFSSRGTFLKDLSLEDDAKIYKYSVDGDSSMVPHPGNNLAILRGAMATAADGNIYLMRWLSPAVIYVISPGGEVVRRMMVDAGDSGAMPDSMRIAGDSIAIEFRNKDTKKKLFKIVDLEGKLRGTYNWPEFEGKPVWLSLCYMQNPQRFVFLDQAKDENPAAEGGSAALGLQRARAPSEFARLAQMGYNPRRWERGESMGFRNHATKGRLSALAVFSLAVAQSVLLHAATWQQLAPATSPSARSYCAMAYDPVSKKIVLFGGQGSAANLNDTWTFDGTTWTQITTASAPPVRNGATMGFDRPSKKLILFGGFNGKQYLQDTWVWDGATSTWTQASMPSPPPKATGAMLFSDPVTGKATMFGGYNATKVIPVSSFTWQWTGTAWTKLNPSTVPYPRGWGIAALDPVHHNVVLTGGNGDTIRTDNTWTWDGTNWALLSPATQIEALIGAGYAFDPAEKAVVVFGGLAETWTWDGTTWTLLTPTTSPSARSAVGMAYDPATRQTVLFGGLLANGPVTNETWEFVGP